MTKSKKQKTENTFYSLKNILSKNCDYNIVFGERSNGKTYAALKYCIDNYLTKGKQSAYVRRWREDMKGKRGASLFSGHVDYIHDITDGKYNEVFYMGNRWFLSYFDAETGKRTPDLNPFMFSFAISEQEHEKSSSYPDITTVVFDEFLTRRTYLPDEFMLFMNLLSTIIRQRNDVLVLMLGNTVNKFCPYFTEMGLTKVREMQQGNIDIYRFGKGGATVAVEYAGTTNENKPSNKYFCFDNEKLEMITGGKWELNAYPRLPVKYRPKDVVFIYFIEYQDIILQGNIICTGDNYFTFIHRKTTPIPENCNNIVYSLIPNGLPNYRRKLISAATELDKKIARFFAQDKVFFQDNEIGEVVRNYILSSSGSNILK